MQRLDADRLHRVERPRLVGGHVFEIDLCVAAAGEDVAARAVGVEVGAGPGLERMRRVEGIHEPIRRRRGLGKQRRPLLREVLRVGIGRGRLAADPRPAILVFKASLDRLGVQGTSAVAPPVHLEQPEMLERAELVVGRVALAKHLFVVVVAVELDCAEAQHVIAGTAVADHALCPRQVVPLLRLHAVGMLREVGGADLELAVLAFGRHEDGVGLLVVPLVAVAGPLALFLEHEAGLNPLSRGRIALLLVNRERLHEHCAIGKVPAAGIGHADLRRHDLSFLLHRLRQGEKPRLVGAVAPEGRGRLVGHDAGHHFVAGDRREEPALREFFRERGLILGDRRCGHERVEATRLAGLMIADQHLALGVGAEARDLERGVGDELVPGDLLAIVADAPDAAGRIVGVDVGALELRQGRACVDESAGHRPRLGVGMFRDRLRDRRRARLLFIVELVGALDDAPAVIGAAFDQVNLLPEVLPLIAHPDLAGLLVDHDPPRLPQAVGIGLGPGVFHRCYEAARIEDRIVLGHGVVPAVVGRVFIGVVYVDPQDF